MGTTRRILLAALALAFVAGAPVARGAEPVGAAESFPTNCQVGEIAAAKEGGGAWFACFDPDESGYDGHASAGRVAPNGQVVEYDDASFPRHSFPGKVAVGGDGSFWMALESPPDYYGPEPIAPRLARVTPSGETSVIPLSLSHEERILELVAAPGGYLWFAGAVPYMDKDVAIWQVSPSGAVSRVPAPLRPNRLPGLVVGAEGDLWFTGAGSGTVEAPFFRLAPGGTPVEVGGGNGAGQRSLAPDGSIWFLGGSKAPAVGRITPDGRVIDDVAAKIDAEEGTISATVAGADSSLWFGTHGFQRPTIGRVTPSGKVESFQHCLVFSQPYFGPERLVRGTEGDIWFTSVESRNLPHIADPPSIGRVTPDGRITQIYGLEREPWTIAAGPEGGVYFASDGRAIQHIGPITGKVNGFYVGRFIRTERDGRSLVTVWVPSAGKVRIKPLALHVGRGLRGRLPLHAKATTATVGCGTPQVQVRPVGPAARAFREHGLAVETAAVTFTPRGGTPYTEEATLHLRRPKH
ncbi:MAG TPA: hypothetical protein VHA80_00685 [Solirubrobacterales bacterium]|nr:hypothetical protein [Solirubrobacterales bacterium]